jgi:hypothetical protein
MCRHRVVPGSRMLAGALSLFKWDRHALDSTTERAEPHERTYTVSKLLHAPAVIHRSIFRQCRSRAFVRGIVCSALADNPLRHPKSLLYFEPQYAPTGVGAVNLRIVGETLLPERTRQRGQLMKSGHNIRQNQPIINATDDTSGDLRSSTHACTASLHRSRHPDCKNGVVR